MIIKKITFKNFRSTGQSNSPLELKKFNLFIGENNSGKSNTIRIIPFLHDLARRLPQLTGSFNPSANNSHTQIEDFFFKDEKEITISTTFSFKDKKKEDFVSGLPNTSQFKAELFNNQGNEVAISFAISPVNENKLNYRLTELKWVDTPLISVADKIMRKTDGQFQQDKFDELYGSFQNIKAEFNYLHVMLNKFNEFHTHLRIIKAVRKIGGSSQSDDGNTSSRIINQLDIDGTRLIDDVSTWRSPNNSFGAHYKKYETLNAFVSSLLEIDVVLLISDDKKQLLIKPVNEKEGDIMSYKSWGSSVEELIVLIVNILSSPDNSIIALEEPEIHLDPFMQRKLILFLKEKTDHQYLISSHSNILINSFNDGFSRIFRVFNEDGATQVETANEEVLHHVLDDLGVKASDILQANGIIWVEGPSDRIFINKWISLMNQKLEEGVHYSIMFYGGKLLSHLSADITKAEQDSEVEDFIKLVSLNRNMAVVIDSDKKNAEDEINATKKRIEEEVGKNSDRAIVWITDGREIENYIPPAMFEETLGIKSMGDYTRISKLSRTYVKVDGANALTETMTKDIFSQNKKLQKKVTLLMERIVLWNKDE